MVESLQQAINYMEEHLLEPIGIEDIAREAHMSPFHFQRTFMILTDTSVGEYIRRRRLTLAAQELTDTDCKIIDLAGKYGYDTPEAFTKAFRKQHGVTPSAARKGDDNLQSYNRLTIQVQLKGAEPMRYRIVERDRFQVTGIQRTFRCSEAGEQGIPEIQALWGEAHQTGLIDQLVRLNNGEMKGLLGLTVDYSGEKNELNYWVAAEHTGEVPDGLARYEVPPSKWAVFEVRGPVPEAIALTWRKIYSEWFPSNSYEHAGSVSIELYTDADPTRPDSYSEIWVPVTAPAKARS